MLPRALSMLKTSSLPCRRPSASLALLTLGVRRAGASRDANPSRRASSASASPRIAGSGVFETRARAPDASRLTSSSDRAPSERSFASPSSSIVARSSDDDESPREIFIRFTPRRRRRMVARRTVARVRTKRKRDERGVRVRRAASVPSRAR